VHAPEKLSSRCQQWDERRLVNITEVGMTTAVDEVQLVAKNIVSTSDDEMKQTHPKRYPPDKRNSADGPSHRLRRFAKQTRKFVMLRLSGAPPEGLLGLEESFGGSYLLFLGSRRIGIGQPLHELGG
jgi:hypothetical protein